MILTVTLNPSLDYYMEVPLFLPGAVNRSLRERIYPGGKGINVSIMLAKLGVENTATGFTAGFTGEALEKLLLKHAVRADFIGLQSGNTRINLKIKSQCEGEKEKESEINGRGPDIPAECFDILLGKLESLGKGDTLVLAGNAQPSISGDAYARILKKASGNAVRTVIDVSGNILKEALKYRPFLIKPNRYELGELVGKELKTRADIISAAETAQNLGAENVLVSMDMDGGLLLCANGHKYECAAPKGDVLNSVGAGDSMLAGFLAGLFYTGSYEKALKLGVAAGSASAFNEWLAEMEDIAALLDDPGSYGL